MNDEVEVTSVAKSIDLAGIEYYDDCVKVRFRLTTTSDTSTEFEVKVANNLLQRDRSANEAVKVASRKLRDIAKTFSHKTDIICQELGTGTWPFPKF